MATTPASTGSKTRKKKVKRTVPHARVCIHAGENNTIVTITDRQGNALSWATAGGSGFRGSRKSTPYAAQIAAEIAARKAIVAEANRLMVRDAGRGVEGALNRSVQQAAEMRENMQAIGRVAPVIQAAQQQPMGMAAA